MGLMTFYTCYLTVRTTSTHPCRPGVVLDFSDLCEYYLGKAGKWICFLFSAIAFLGALIVFWVRLARLKNFQMKLCELKVSLVLILKRFIREEIEPILLSFDLSRF